MNTTTDRGDDPLKRVSQQEQDFEKHAKNTRHLQEKAEELDGFADSMRVSYEEESQIGSVMLYFEYYDDENYHKDEATDEFGHEALDEYFNAAIDLVKGGEFREAMKYINACKKLTDDEDIHDALMSAKFYCDRESEEHALSSLYDAQNMSNEE